MKTSGWPTASSAIRAEGTAGHQLQHPGVDDAEHRRGAAHVLDVVAHVHVPLRDHPVDGGADHHLGEPGLGPAPAGRRAAAAWARAASSAVRASSSACRVASPASCSFRVRASSRAARCRGHLGLEHAPPGPPARRRSPRAPSSRASGAPRLHLDPLGHEDLGDGAAVLALHLGGAAGGERAHHLDRLLQVGGAEAGRLHRHRGPAGLLGLGLGGAVAGREGHGGGGGHGEGCAERGPGCRRHGVVSGRGCAGAASPRKTRSRQRTRPAFPPLRRG